MVDGGWCTSGAAWTFSTPARWGLALAISQSAQPVTFMCSAIDSLSQWAECVSDCLLTCKCDDYGVTGPLTECILHSASAMKSFIASRSQTAATLKGTN